MTSFYFTLLLLVTYMLRLILSLLHPISCIAAALCLTLCTNDPTAPNTIKTTHHTTFHSISTAKQTPTPTTEANRTNPNPLRHRGSLRTIPVCRGNIRHHFFTAQASRTRVDENQGPRIRVRMGRVARIVKRTGSDADADAGADDERQNWAG